MSQLITQEIAIVISVPVQNPTMLNEDFLKQTGIIPSDWKLERDPVYSDRVAQIMFTNGFSIVAQPDRLMFLELVGDRSIETINVGEVAQKYVAILKMADYHTVGLNFRSYVSQSSPNAATEYINSKLLSGGSWQQYGSGKMRASVNLNYDLAERHLNLSIDAAKVQFPTPSDNPALVFSGTFSYDTPASSDDRVTAIAKIIGNWKQELNEFNAFIAGQLLSIVGEPANKAQSISDYIEFVDAPVLPPILFTYN